MQKPLVLIPQIPMPLFGVKTLVYFESEVFRINLRVALLACLLPHLRRCLQYPFADLAFFDVSGNFLIIPPKTSI
jgi:hypothetical protein